MNTGSNSAKQQSLWSGTYESSDYNGLVRACHQRRGDLRAAPPAGAGAAWPRGAGGDPVQQPAQL